MKKSLLITLMFIVCFFGESQAQWTTSGSNIYYNAGNVGIGVNAPGALLEVRVPTSLNSTAPTTSEIARFTSLTSNYSQLRFSVNRYAAGTDWTTASTRIQAWTDGTAQGYIDFNPPGGSSGIAFGSSAGTSGAGIEIMHLNTNGNVGIGTTTPQSALSVGTSQGIALSIGNPTWGTTRIIQTGWDPINTDYTDVLVPGAIANNSIFRLTSHGIAGLGTTSLLGGLSIGSSHGIKLSMGNAAWLSTKIIETGWDAGNGDYTDLYVPASTANTALLRLTGGGNVLIGKTSQSNNTYKLDVNGNVRANKIVVNTTGADFVFEKKYPLMDLSTLEKYINENQHLPGIETAKQMQANGVDLGDNQTKLLQKIEELTLYVIEQQKQMEELKVENKGMKITLIKLKKAIKN